MEEVEVCSATAADDDALALRIEMVDVEDDDAAAALQIAVNNVMTIRDGLIVLILLSGWTGLQATVCLLLMEPLSMASSGDFAFISSFYPR